MFNAYAAHEANGRLEPFSYDPGPLAPHDVEIAVEHCGICHSDLSMLENAFGFTQYPLVPGHEAVGTVATVGDQVSHLAVGDRVGLGWFAGFCQTCPDCLRGDHNMCGGASSTIVGRHGAFADRVRAQAASVLKLPDGVDAATAGPLFCGGITVFNPLVQMNLPPTASVGVIGIGGLGHLALKFANAWGCEVTAFTSHEAKADEARQMGAHHVVNSRDPDALQGVARSLDLVISTVNVKLDWNAYLETLKPRGHLHVVGAVLEPLDVSVFSMLLTQRSVGSSPTGSPATMARMLEFCARHDIRPTTEHFPMAQVNEALDHLRSGQARYRLVLDRE